MPTAVSAERREFFASRFLDLVGPRLAGDEVVWASEEGGRFHVKSASPAGRRLLVEFPSREQGLERLRPVTVSLASSAKRVAIGRHFLTSEQFGAQGIALPVLSGPLRGPLEPISEECRGSPADVDVSGDTVAMFSGDCEFGVEVRDFSPDAAVREGRVFVNPFRIAGRYVAGWAGDRFTLAIYDWKRGTELYRVRAPGRTIRGEDGLHDFDVQEDGKVAFAYDVRAPLGLPAQRRLAWASPQEPFPHRLPLERSDGYGVRMAGDRIAFLRDVRRLFRDRDFELGLVTLRGRSRFLAYPDQAPLHTGFSPPEHFDFDGRRVAWIRHRCYSAAVVVQDADGRPDLRRRRSGCRLRFRRAPRLRGDRVLLDLDCRGFSRRCDTSQVVLRTAARFPVAASRTRRRLLLGVGRLPGGRDGRRFSIRLSLRGRELLRRHKRLRVLASAGVGGPGGGQFRRGAFTLSVRGRA